MLKIFIWESGSKIRESESGHHFKSHSNISELLFLQLNFYANVEHKQNIIFSSQFVPAHGRGLE